jgi:outer membrane protein insertion porin family
MYGIQKPILLSTVMIHSNFINALGMGTGLGLRVDIQDFVIRFNLAAPFHDPSLEKGQRFDFQFDKPVLNFAIGYSF